MLVKHFNLGIVIAIFILCGIAKANSICPEFSDRKVRRYSVSEGNVAQLAAFESLKAIFYVECFSTYKEQYENLTEPLNSALRAYEVASTYSQVNRNVYDSLKKLASSLGPVEHKLRLLLESPGKKVEANKYLESLARFRRSYGY